MANESSKRIAQRGVLSVSGSTKARGGTATRADINPIVVAKRSGTRAWGQFDIIRELGRGGMGVVFEARDRLLDRRVALKVLHGREECSQDSGELLLKEARTIAKFEHPNIVGIHQVGTHEGKFFIAMQFVQGGSAADLIKKGTLPLDQINEIALAAADALSVAHENKVIHRDIKPHNILLGSDGSVKLADFGLARATSTHGPTTASEVWAGTPHYMSPEQARGLPTDARSDIYSLGATLFHLLAGRAPFPGKEPLAVMIAHMEHEPPDIRELREDIPESWAKIIEKMLEKKPQDRYQTIEQMEDDWLKASAESKLGGKLLTGRVTNLRTGALLAAVTVIITVVVLMALDAAGKRAQARKAASVEPNAASIKQDQSPINQDLTSVPSNNSRELPKPSEQTRPQSLPKEVDPTDEKMPGEDPKTTPREKPADPPMQAIGIVRGESKSAPTSDVVEEKTKPFRTSAAGIAKGSGTSTDKSKTVPVTSPSSSSSSSYSPSSPSTYPPNTSTSTNPSSKPSTPPPPSTTGRSTTKRPYYSYPPTTPKR